MLVLWATSSLHHCWWMLLWVSVTLKVIEAEEEVVVLGVQAKQLVHRRVQWYLEVLVGKNDDSLQVLCCLPLEKLGWVAVGSILVM